MNTSKARKIKRPSISENRRVDRRVVEKYEQLVKSSGGLIIVKGADYGIAPPVGTSKLLIRSLLGKAYRELYRSN